MVNLRANEQRRPEFLALNPGGTVPVIRDGDTVLYDSTIINEYLEEQYPQPSLTFPDPPRRGRVRQWEDFGDNNFLRPAENIFIHNKGWRTFEEEQIRGFRQKIQESLTYVEKALEGQEYIMNRFTYADIAFAPRIILLDQLRILLPQDFVNIHAWIDRLKKRPSLTDLEH